MIIVSYFPGNKYSSSARPAPAGSSSNPIQPTNPPASRKTAAFYERLSRPAPGQDPRPERADTAPEISNLFANPQNKMESAAADSDVHSGRYHIDDGMLNSHLNKAGLPNLPTDVFRSHCKIINIMALMGSQRPKLRQLIVVQLRPCVTRQRSSAHNIVNLNPLRQDVPAIGGHKKTKREVARRQGRPGGRGLRLT
ncbi:hypothetical protein Bbelb_137160 [Branchiostoma belcheri]|nr:hypothetical protein Bbelb_137160 [Branchiostoma belcheri]